MAPGIPVGGGCRPRACRVAGHDPPRPAEAQSTVTLVSNMGLGAQTTVLFGGSFGGSNPKRASSFTTGPDRYGLAAVTLRLTSAGGSPTLDIAVHSDSGGAPGQRLFALDNPTHIITSSLHVIFGAPPSSWLTPNTTYWVVAGTTSGAVRLALTAGDGERPGKQPGWSIGDSLVSMSGPDASWVTDARSVQMIVQGVVFDSFVYNLTSGAPSGVIVGDDDTAAASAFTTGPNEHGYGLDSVTLRVGTFDGSPKPIVSVHSDGNGTPGQMLFVLNPAGNIPQLIANYAFDAPPGTRLTPRTTYWLVIDATGGNLTFARRNNGDENEGKQPGWGIGNDLVRQNGPNASWTLVASNIAVQMDVRGAVYEEAIVRTQNELAWDLPLSDDTWGYVDTSGPSSGTMDETVDDLRSNGDRWRLHVDSSRRYRVEVNFGSATPQDGYDEGGGIDVWDFTPRSDLWDHRSDDGRAFIEFHASPRTPYYLLVRARSFGEHQTWEYFGDYTITLTDISHIYQMVSNGWAAFPIPDFNSSAHIIRATKRIGDHPEFEGEIPRLWEATPFTTGPRQAGYRLEYITAGLWLGSGVPSVKAALYSDSSNNPGTKLFDFERISPITNAYSALNGDRFWVPASAADLTANTTYWVVFKNETPGTHYRVRKNTLGTNNAGAASGWSIGTRSSWRNNAVPSSAWIQTLEAIVMDIHASHATTGGATEAVDQAAPQLQSASVDGSTLTLAYDEELDLTSSPPSSAFTVNVNGEERPLVSVGVGQSGVLLSLSTPVEAGDTVTVDYTVPTGESEGKLQDPAGNAASSFTGQQVTNDTASSGGSGGGESGEADPPAAVPLTATAHGVPADHDGSATFSFELRFSETPEDDFSYKTLRDHAFSVTGGQVVKANRLVNGENVRWQVPRRAGRKRRGDHRAAAHHGL